VSQRPSRPSLYLSSRDGHDEKFQHLFARAQVAVFVLFFGDLTNVFCSWSLIVRLLSVPHSSPSPSFIHYLLILNVLKVVLFIGMPLVQYYRHNSLSHISDQGWIVMGIALFSKAMSVLDLRLCALNFSEAHMYWALLATSTFFFELILVVECQALNLHTVLMLDFVMILVSFATPVYFLGWAATASIDGGDSEEIGLVTQEANRVCKLAKIARAIQIHSNGKQFSNQAVVAFGRDVYNFMRESTQPKRLKKNVIRTFVTELLGLSAGLSNATDSEQDVSTLTHYIRVLNRYYSVHRVESLLIRHLPPELASLVTDYQFR